jgi:hypothetical protein
MYIVAIAFQCKQGWFGLEDDAHLLSDEASCSLLGPICQTDRCTLDHGCKFCATGLGFLNIVLVYAYLDLYSILMAGMLCS